MPWLVHYGIKGQKWGVRRYQNLDGTLTPLGKERYNKYADGMSAKKKQFNDKVVEKLRQAGVSTDEVDEKLEEHAWYMFAGEIPPEAQEEEVREFNSALDECWRLRSEARTAGYKDNIKRVGELQSQIQKADVKALAMYKKNLISSLSDFIDTVPEELQYDAVKWIENEVNNFKIDQLFGEWAF